LIFDINGEYANDNDQDNNSSIYSANKNRCEVYALTQRVGTPSKQLKLNFYEDVSSCKEIIGNFLENDNKKSNYINSFASVVLPSIEDIEQMENLSDKSRAIRRVQMYWCILFVAGFRANEESLKKKRAMYTKYLKPFEPHFNKELRDLVYNNNAPEQPNTLESMVEEYRNFVMYERVNGELQKDRKPLFDVDDKALLGFLFPSTGSGPIILSTYRDYHSPSAGDFVNEIISLLDNGKTVILDLGNANDNIRKYFSDLLSTKVFRSQEKKFVNNTLGNTYIQLYFEEAHNLFPPQTKDNQDVYSRFAKEGAKFHIGMVYSTQSPSTISKELLVQTENFFVGHLSSLDETKALVRTQIAFDGVEEDILRARTPGYMRMLTMSNRFVIPVQAKLYKPERGE